MFINGFDILWDEIDDYVADIKSIRSIDQFMFNKPVTFFCGENGSGKSTLLEALAIKAFIMWRQKKWNIVVFFLKDIMINRMVKVSFLY